MDRPPPYSEIDQSPNRSQSHSPVIEGSSSPSTLPSAPMSYSTGDAKITYNSPRQSFSPPHLPPSPQIFMSPSLPYMPPLGVPPKNNTCRPTFSSGCRGNWSRSPTAGPSRTQSYNSNEQWKQSKRRSSVDSLSSSSSSTSSNSSKSSTTKQEKEALPKFDNRKSSVDMKETNKKLEWDGPPWYGKHFSMKTTNAKINVRGTLDAKFLSLNTTNAMINWTGESVLCKDLDIRTTNAKVELVGDSVAAKQGIKVKTTNAQLLFDKPTVVAKDISAITSNAEIRILRAQVKRSLYCKTSNARVILHIKSIQPRTKSKSPPKINVEVVTSNAPVIIHMPADFAGEFKLATSQSKAVIFDDPQDAVVYNPDKKSSSRDGYRFKKNGGSLKVTTSQSDITIVFDQ